MQHLPPPTPVNPRQAGAELGPLLEKNFPFGDARMKALRTLAPFIFDAATGAQQVLAAFKFESERKEAGEVLAAAAQLPPGWGRTGLADALAARLAKEHFDEGRLAAVTQTLSMGGWTPMACAAAAPILERFPFGDARLSALRLLAPHLGDIPTGQGKILGAFKFDGERQQAGAILAEAVARGAGAGGPPSYPAAPSSGGGAYPYPGGGNPGMPTGGGMTMGGAAPMPTVGMPPHGAPDVGAAMAGAMGAAMGAMGAMAGFASQMGAAMQPQYPGGQYPPGYPGGAPGFPGGAPGFPGGAPGFPGFPGGAPGGYPPYPPQGPRPF